MITIQEKLRSYSEKITEYVRNETDRKYQEFISKQKEESEKKIDEASEESEEILTNSILEAEKYKKQVLYNAVVEKDKAVLSKRYDLFNSFIDEIKIYAKEYTKKGEYEQILLKTIELGMNEIQSNYGCIYVTAQDKNNYGKKIEEFIRNIFPDKTFSVKISEKNIIGGCLIEDNEGTERVDCSFVTIIEDNKEYIGKILNDTLFGKGQ